MPEAANGSAAWKFGSFVRGACASRDAATRNEKKKRGCEALASRLGLHRNFYPDDEPQGQDAGRQGIHLRDDDKVHAVVLVVQHRLEGRPGEQVLADPIRRGGAEVQRVADELHAALYGEVVVELLLELRGAVD